MPFTVQTHYEPKLYSRAHKLYCFNSSLRVCSPCYEDYSLVCVDDGVQLLETSP